MNHRVLSNVTSAAVHAIRAVLALLLYELILVSPAPMKGSVTVRQLLIAYGWSNDAGLPFTDCVVVKLDERIVGLRLTVEFDARRHRLADLDRLHGPQSVGNP